MTFLSISHRDNRDRSAASWQRLAPLIAAALLVGCGGGDKPTAPTPPSGVAQETQSAADPGTTTADSSAKALPGSLSSGDSGLQLPDLPVPDVGPVPADSNAPSGPTPAGKGGIEMPDLDLSPQSATEKPTSDSVQSVTTAAAAASELIFASWAEIESHAKSTGTITVVDLWSTSCAPCLKEFPGLVQLDKSMPDKVTCIGVSVDYDGRKTRPPESYTATVTAFLKAVEADFDNYLCNTPSDDVFTAVDLPSIPAVLVFDATGKLVKKFVDAGETLGFSYEADVTPFVVGLVGS